MNHHWIEVFRYEVRQMLRRKAYLFMTFVVPVLAVAAFMGYRAIQESTTDDEAPQNPLTQQAETNGNGIAIGYVDLTLSQAFPPPDSYPAPEGGCAVSEADRDLDPAIIIKRLGSPYCVGRDMAYYSSLDNGKDALRAGEIDVLYVIEPDYLETGSVSSYLEGFSIEAAESNDQFDSYLLASLLQDADPATFERLYLRLRNPAAIMTHRLGSTGEAETSNQNQDFVVVYAFGLIMMLSLFWGGGYLMQSVVQEKESRIIEIILSSVPPTPLLLGKVLAMGLLSLLQVAMLLGAFVIIGSQIGEIVDALGNIEISTRTLVITAVYFVLGFLMFGSLMAAIGAMTASVRESQNLVTVVTLPSAIPFFFLQIFIDNPNGMLPKVLSFIPLTAPLSMVMRVANTTVPLGEILLSIALLIVGVAVSIWFAGRLFRVNTLLRGNTPKIKDIPTLLRG